MVVLRPEAFVFCNRLQLVFLCFCIDSQPRRWSSPRVLRGVVPRSFYADPISFRFVLRFDCWLLRVMVSLVWHDCNLTICEPRGKAGMWNRDV